MPYGKGTYGSTKGRPPKDAKKKLTKQQLRAIMLKKKRKMTKVKSTKQVTILNLQCVEHYLIE